MIQKTFIKHIYRFLFLYVPLLVSLDAMAFPQTLSPNSVISILTCEPGKDLYSTFGHIAIRVRDSTLDLDITFNYGTFDFNDPAFYEKFARGKLKYFLSVSSFNDFKLEYEQEGRNIKEQILNLHQNDIDTLYYQLLENYKPENRFYSYDFFYDNCSTRIRDILHNSLEGHISILRNTDTSRSTFRQLMNDYLDDFQWAALGMNLGQGMRTDKIANYNEQMFLPDRLYNGIANATIYNNENLVSRTIIHDYKANYTYEDNQTYITPLLIFWMLFIVVAAITLFEMRSHRHFSMLDNIVFITSGVLGFILLFFWFGTSHRSTKDNLNLLWLSPLNCFVPVFKLKSKIYLQVYSLILIVLLLCYNWLPQEFLPSYIPLMLIFLMRSLKLLSRTKAVL